MEHLIFGVIAAGLVGVATAIYYFYIRSTTTPSTKISTKNANTSTTAKAPYTTRLKNVWDVSKNTNTSSVKSTHDDKPFGSKYYYAHNNPNATGGYKDGLKMEDYAMNGPRLLRKGGTPVDSDKASIQSGTNSKNGEVTEALVPEKSETKAPSALTPIRTIVKYLWDDPGDWNGTATIRIDTLPNKNGEPVDWKSIKVNEVKVDLVGEGLLVVVEADECRYQLKIAKLYGDAAEVKAAVKPKRLLVKITKKKNSVLAVRKESNLDAWPQPHRKI
jgi:hypothetical protein